MIKIVHYNTAKVAEFMYECVTIFFIKKNQKMKTNIKNIEKCYNSLFYNRIENGIAIALP